MSIGSNEGVNCTVNPDVAAHVSRFEKWIDSDVRRKSSAFSKWTSYTRTVGQSFVDPREPANGILLFRTGQSISDISCPLLVVPTRIGTPSGLSSRSWIGPLSGNVSGIAA